MTGPTDLPVLDLPGGGRMPMLGLGTWQLRGGSTYETVRHALELGYRQLDTATVYRNEDEVGRALADSDVPREEVFVTTKLPPDRASRAEETLDASLRALRVDHVDLWLIHWPPGRSESLRAWEALVSERDRGRAVDVGVSNYDAGQIDALVGATSVTPAVNQIPWSPFEHDPAVVEEHRSRGVVLEGYSPFKRSRLSDPVLREIADAHGVTAAQVVLRWHLQRGIVVIPKTATTARLKENLDIGGFELTDDELARVDSLSS